MQQAGWDAVKDIVSSALELPRSQRDRYIDETCGGDTAVRSRVEELIGSYDAGHNFFRQLEEDLALHEYELTSLAPGEMVLDRYEVRAFLARGGSGEIYEAYDREVGERVALKVLRSRYITDSQVERFRSEVRLAHKVQNPAVCRVHDGARFTRADGERMLVISMELLDGETLSAYLRRNAPLHPDRAMAILRQIADGLDAAHQSGIIHRDLKSANIMLTGVESGSPRAVITDFGLACLLDDHGGSPIVGTPAYMAPEQVEGQPLSAATDIYALGVIAYEMVTGKLPFGGDSPMDIARARLSEPPAPPRSVNPSVSVRWDRAILGCLALDPARRFKHASYFIAAIELSRGPWLLSAVLLAISGSALWGWSTWQEIHTEAPLPGSVVIAGFTSPTDPERQMAEAFREELAAGLAGVPGVVRTGRVGLLLRPCREDQRRARSPAL